METSHNGWRERLRLQAVERFARGGTISEIAHDLRVTEGSVRRWHRAWRDGGAEALRSKGPVGTAVTSALTAILMPLVLARGAGAAPVPRVISRPDECRLMLISA